MKWLQELGISGGTAIVVLLALYFTIKAAVVSGIKVAYKSLKGENNDK